MLVFLMLLGAVLCSPVPQSTYRRDTSERNEKLDPHSSSSPYKIEIFHSVNSPPIFSLTHNQGAPLRIENDKNVFRIDEGSRESSLETDIDDDDDNSKSVMSLHQPEDDEHNTILLDSQLKRVDRLPRNSILPPLILAHQSSEISLEPTEVEAPGTTPTTLSMITEPTVKVVRNSTDKPPTSHNLNRTNTSEENLLNKNNASDIHTPADHLKSNEDFPPANGDEAVEEEGRSSLHVSVQNERVASSIDLDKDMHHVDSMLQMDDPTIGPQNDSITDPNSKFKIKAFNNTYTLVHEKTDRLAANKNASRKESMNIYSEDSELNEKSASLKIPSEEDKPLEYNMEDGEAADDNSKLTNRHGNIESSDNLEQKNRESKRIVTAAELLFNISNHKALLDPGPSETLHQNQKIKSSEVLIEEEKVQDDTFIDSVLIGAEHIGAKPEGDNSDTELDTEYRDKDKGKSSNIETREVDNDSFFILVNSEVVPKVVKKDDADVAKSADESRYRMDVITSSSEVTYKQFDPLKNNSSVFNNNFDSLKTFNISPAKDYNNDKNTAEQDNSQNSITNSSSQVTSTAKELAMAVLSTKERSLESNSSSDDQIVTSLPSQTSVVEPLRTNTSSTLAEVTLPSSHHRTKSDQSAANSHAISSAVASDSVGRSPLGLFPPEESSSFVDSRTPPVQQERLSIPVAAEHVSSSISAGCVAAIVSGVLITMVIIGGAIAYVLYRRLEGFRPKILSPDRSCANSDSGGYLDDQCRVAYVNSQIDLPKSTPEDLVSLDNDSFLNSLESMTIQNLWTDSIRHTKL